MAEPRVLVTGAGGFIGRHLVRRQLELGRTVFALDQHADSLGRLTPNDRLHVMAGDVTDRDVQRRAVEGVDIVFHMASAHLERGLPDSEYERINVHAVGGLLEVSRDAGIGRFVQVSSCGVHGALEYFPGDEESPCNPDITYERTKLAGERIALDYCRETGFPVVVVRPVWVYGPGCNRTARLFSMINKGRFLMVGQGANLRSAIYITDMLDALELAATTEGAVGEIFIATHDERVTVRQVVRQIADISGAPFPRIRVPLAVMKTVAMTAEVAGRIVGREPPISRRSLKFFTNDAGFTSAKAQRMLDFHPRVALDEGLGLTYEWWRKNSGG